MATKIVLTNQKGGVGKTTSTCALSTGLALKGYRVLTVDLDPQGNLGFSLGLNIDEGYSAYEVLAGQVSIKDAIKATEDYGDVLISNILLSQAEKALVGEERQTILKKCLEQVEENYDYIIIDTPPSLNILTINGYVAADYLIIPMAAEILSLVGLSQIKETVEAISESLNPNLKVLGILLTRFNKRTNLARDVQEMAEAVAKKLDTVVFNTKIRSSVAVAEAPAHGISLYDYSPRSNSTKDYKEFVEEIVVKI